MSDPFALVDEAFLRRIDRLALAVRRRRTGQQRGERRSTRRGTSVEFADYRDYAKGDDLRHVDWNIYARLERPFVKLFEEQEDLTVHLLLDASRSMDWPPGQPRGAPLHGQPAPGHPRGASLHGQPAPGRPQGAPLPETHKWLYARRTAAALGYIALSSGDRLLVALLHEGSPSQFGPVRGKGQTMPFLRWLGAQQAAGTADLDRALRDYAFAARHPGLVVLISDLFPPYRDGLSALLARGYEALMLHVLSPDEADPPLAGELKLVDVESGHEQEVTVDAAMRDLYRQRLADWQQDNARWAAQYGAAYVPVTTDLPFDQLILYHLRQRGLVR